MKIYAIKDEKVGWMNILTDSNDDVAIFNFGRGFYCDNPELGRLEDYSLYSIGKIDTVQGFEYYDNPNFLINGLSAYNQFVSRLKVLNIDRLEMKEDADSNFSQENK